MVGERGGDEEGSRIAASSRVERVCVTEDSSRLTSQEDGVTSACALVCCGSVMRARVEILRRKSRHERKTSLSEREELLADLLATGRILYWKRVSLHLSLSPNCFGREGEEGSKEIQKGEKQPSQHLLTSYAAPPQCAMRTQCDSLEKQVGYNRFVFCVTHTQSDSRTRVFLFASRLAVDTHDVRGARGRNGHTRRVGKLFCQKARDKRVEEWVEQCMTPDEARLVLVDKRVEEWVEQCMTPDEASDWLFRLVLVELYVRTTLQFHLY